MKSSTFLSVAAAVLFLTPAALRAQISPAKGGDTVTTKTYAGAVDLGYSYPHIGVEGDFGGSSRWGFGARLETGITKIMPTSPQYRLIGSFNYFPGGSSNNWELNANAIDLFPVRNFRMNSYLGAGLNVAHVSPTIGNGATNLGLNLLAGIRFLGAQAPYLEGRLELGGGNQFLIALGYNFK